MLKLFNLVMPHSAIFGKKDYQQYLVLRDMVRQFALPIEIIPAETVRAQDGLALSSRNNFLSPAERKEAPRLYGVLKKVRDAIGSGARDFHELAPAGVAELTRNGWHRITLPYAGRRPAADTERDRDLVIVAAARWGRTAPHRQRWKSFCVPERAIMVLRTSRTIAAALVYDLEPPVADHLLSSLGRARRWRLPSNSNLGYNAGGAEGTRGRY